MSKCFICKQEAPSKTSPESHRIMDFVCRKCGKYKVDVMCYEAVKDLDHNELSGVTRFTSETSQPVTITLENIKTLKASIPKINAVTEKTNRLLRAIARHSRFPGKSVLLTNDDQSLAFATNHEEFHYYLNWLEEQGWISVLSRTSAGYDVTITPEGWQVSQGMQNTESAKAFIAMSFAPELKSVFIDGIKPAVEDVGYEAVRVDGVEFNGDVVEEIIAGIRESRFVISDVTGQRNGVYFEAGFAMGLGLPVIWTCNKKDSSNLHFDTEHFNHILWETPQEFRGNLSLRIRATIGQGPQRSSETP